MTASCGSPMDWSNCYSGQYDLWAPESYAHPAKGSPALFFRILEHLAELGLLHPGQTVLDPMCGTGTTLLVAAVKGHPAVGMELEARFVDCVKGFLCPGIAHYTVEEEHLAAEEAGWRVKEVHRTDDEAGVEERRYWQRALPERIKYRVHVTSRCGKPGWHVAHRVIGNARRLASKGFGAPIRIIQGDARNLSTLLQERGLCAVSSPPYFQAGAEASDATVGIRGRDYARQRYGSTPGQIGSLPDRPCAITSPPYEDSDQAGAERPYTWERVSGRAFGAGVSMRGYPLSDGQIGQERGATYLSAMSLVYAEIAKVADVLAIVLKNPTRNGKLRNLTLDTFLLLKSCTDTLYCNCATEGRKEGIALDDNEWNIYQALVQEGAPLFSMRVYHQQQVQDGEMPQAQPEGALSPRTLRSDESQVTSKKVGANADTGMARAPQGGNGKAWYPTSEAAKSLRSLPSTDKQVGQAVSSTLYDAGGNCQDCDGTYGPDSTCLEQRAEVPPPVGTQQSNVARWDERQGIQGEETGQSELAESKDDVPSEGPFHMSDMRQGRVHGSPQARQDMGRRNSDIQLGRPNNPLPFMSYEDGRTAPICGICGKPQVPISERIGWQIHCHHHATLFEEQEQGDMFAGPQKQVKGRMSFFKRLSWAKGSPVAQWEDVIVAVHRGQ